MNKFEKAFYRIGYCEWLVVIFLMSFFILGIITGVGPLIFMTGTLFFVFTGLIFGLHMGYFESSQLKKYRAKYTVLEINANDKTYYLPVGYFISKWGYLYEYSLNSHSTGSSVKYILECIKNDPDEAKDFVKSGVFHTTNESALYVIKQFKEYMDSIKKKNDISVKSTTIKFKNK